MTTAEERRAAELRAALTGHVISEAEREAVEAAALETARARRGLAPGDPWTRTRVYDMAAARVEAEAAAAATLADMERARIDAAIANALRADQAAARRRETAPQAGKDPPKTETR